MTISVDHGIMGTYWIMGMFIRDLNGKVGKIQVLILI